MRACTIAILIIINNFKYSRHNEKTPVRFFILCFIFSVAMATWDLSLSPIQKTESSLCRVNKSAKSSFFSAISKSNDLDLEVRSFWVLYSVPHFQKAQNR